MSSREASPVIDLDAYTGPDIRQSASAEAPTPAAMRQPSAATARADLYQRVADATPAELESMIAGLSAEEGSTERDFALGALLERYAEIDAPRAARVARDSGVHGPPLGLIYAQWATADAAGALEALRSVEDSADAAAIGLALIGALGGNASVIERVGMALLGPDHAAAAAIGPTGFAPFVVGVPGGAGPFGSRSALPSVAASWAMRDTEDALAIVREIRNSTVRGVFETAVLREWARTEPEAMLAHLATLDRATQQRVLFGGALGEVARAEPERLLEMARSFPPELRMPLEQMTLQAIAQRDPEAAIRLAERLPLGMQRQQLFAAVARSYAQHDPDGALAWAKSMPPQQPSLVAAVLAGIAQADPDRAFDLAAEQTTPMERAQALQFVMFAAVQKSDADAQRIADKILARGGRDMQDAQRMLLMAWSLQSPESAMDWLLQDPGRASAGMFRQVGQMLGGRDPAAAAAYTSRIPADGRAEWIRGVAIGYAQSDPGAAVDWLGQFRAEPGYADNVIEIAVQIAAQDGVAAARLLADVESKLNPQQSMQTVSIIATNWANGDPAAAADWALDRRDEQSRSMAVSSVMGVWAHRDFASARQWTLRLPAGELRDASLGTLLVTATATATQSTSASLDAGLLSAFSNETARQQALVQLVASVAYRDRAEARQIIDYYITDRAMRTQAEQIIENAERQGLQSPFFIDGGVQ
jgi:hypothetical protein